MEHSNIPKTHFIKGQALHVLLMTVLIAMTSFLLDWGDLSETSFAGISGKNWVIASLAIVPLHQFYVWFIWRSELVYGNISSLFGGRGFKIYKKIFGLLFSARFALLFIIGLIDRGSLQIPALIQWVLTPIILLPVFYTLYSVLRYFGLERAVGGDHFYSKYRQQMVNRGIYKYVSNAMYTYGTLAFFLFGLWFSSISALLLAAYQYLGLWLHYFSTEKPDMEVLHKN